MIAIPNLDTRFGQEAFASGLPFTTYAALLFNTTEQISLFTFELLLNPTPSFAGTRNKLNLADTPSLVLLSYRALEHGQWSGLDKDSLTGTKWQQLHQGTKPGYGTYGWLSIRRHSLDRHLTSSRFFFACTRRMFDWMFD